MYGAKWREPRSSMFRAARCAVKSRLSEPGLSLPLQGCYSARGGLPWLEDFADAKIAVADVP
jgi:hypothetical protein